MATFILTQNSSLTQIPSPKCQDIFPSLGPLSEMYASRNANIKRRLEEAHPQAETALPEKKVQLSQTSYSKKSKLQLAGSPKTRGQDSGLSSVEQNRRERVHRKTDSKADEDTLLSFVDFFFPSSSLGKDQTFSVNSSLIRDNLSNLSLTNQTSEEPKFEESTSISLEVSKPEIQSKIPRVSSNDSLQLKEDSTALSEPDDNVDQELPNPETPVKINTLVQDPDQKIVEIQVGEKHQVSNEYIASLTNAPRKSRRQITQKWIPSEEKSEMLCTFMEKLGSLFKTSITNEERAIIILRDASNDVESALKLVSKNVNQWKTKFTSTYVGRTGLRERKH